MQKIQTYQYENGFELLVIQKENFVNEFAAIGVDYGAADLTPAELKYAGVAHFLEHKLFTKKDGEISEKFEQLGAEVNAATSANQTTYFAEFQDHEVENIRLLFELIQKPYFTAENVERERQIILQELLMYQDNPYFQLNAAVLAGMYGANSALATDIAGTTASLEQIKSQVLEDFWQRVYRADHLKMVVSSRFDLSQIRQWLDPLVLTLPTPLKEDWHQFYAGGVSQAHQEVTSKITQAKFAVGLKFPKLAEFALSPRLLEELFGMALELNFGSLSNWYQEMVAAQTLNQDPEIYVSFSRQANYAMILGQSAHPETMLSQIKQQLQHFTVTAADFELQQKELLAKTIKLQDRVDDFALEVLDASFAGIDLQAELQALQQLTFPQFQEIVTQLLELAEITTVQMKPQGVKQ